MTHTLLQPYQFGSFTLQNRIVMAPMTRARATLDAKYTFLPNELTAKYYAQRASAGLIITEGVHISQKARGWVNVPGIWSDNQVQQWKKVTSSVHEKGGLVALQLWHQGRTTHSDFGNGAPWAPSSIAAPAPVTVHTPIGVQPPEVPHEMTEEEIALTVKEYVDGAKRAFSAGFDLVEIQAAGGYLIHQFFADSSNHRKDRYGGSVENRARFLKEILLSMKKEFNSLERVGIRIGPTLLHNRTLDSQPIKTYSEIVKIIQEVAPELAFIEVLEDRTLLKPEEYVAPTLRKIWKGIFILNSNINKESGQKLIDEGEADLVSIARPFIANPDLIERYKHNWPVALPDTSRLYYVDADLEKGYTDYPCYNDECRGACSFWHN